MSIKREDKALREFKLIIEDLVILLRKSTGAETVYLHWVNRSREQFVLEANSTWLSNVMFKDRAGFQEHFLENQKNISSPVLLRVGEKIDAGDLSHYYDHCPIRYVTVIPFVNNKETVALTTVETIEPFLLSEHEQVIHSYNGALTNVLNTYLELTDLYGKQQEWIAYDESLNSISTRQHKVEILYRMLNEMQNLLPTGGACLVARGMDTWVNVLNSKGAKCTPALGTMIDEKSLAHDSLKNGKPEFAIHFNQNPKRLSAGETDTEGATLAIPLMIDDRRHGTVVACDSNALTFSDSTKHKLTNLVRVAGLAIRANLGKLSVDDDLLTSEYSSFIPDVWEKAIESELARDKAGSKTWFGLLAVENLQSLRSKYRLEELQRLQRTLVKALNPSLFGFNGYIGFNSDYVFTFLLQDGNSAAEKWLQSVNQMLEKPVKMSDGQQVDVEISAGYTMVTGEGTDFHPIVRKAKAELSEAVKQSVSKKKFFNFNK
jgi:hypothetical protein